MVNFDYQKPENLEDALSLRNKWGETSSLLLGGTDLFLAIEEGGLSPGLLIDLKSVDDLNRLEESADAITIGARVTYSSLIDSSVKATAVSSSLNKSCNSERCESPIAVAPSILNFAFVNVALTFTIPPTLCTSILS